MENQKFWSRTEARSKSKKSQTRDPVEMIYTCSDDRAYGDLSSFVNHALKLLDAYQFLTSSFMPVSYANLQWFKISSSRRLSVASNAAIAPE